MKIQEQRDTDQGFKGPRVQNRVRELAKDEAVPAGAKTMPDDTPVSDWQDEEKN